MTERHRSLTRARSPTRGERIWFLRSALRHARMGNRRWVKRRIRQALGVSDAE